MKTRFSITSLAVASAATLTLAGCSSGGSSSAIEGDELGTITVGYIPSYTDSLALAFLLDDQLSEVGYDIELEPLTEVGPIYAGLAGGSLDIYASAWPDFTHASYMEEYGDDIEDLVTFYDGAENFLAVPTYMEDVNSIEDLVGMGEEFDGTITGIEPGAGLTGQLQNVAMPEYGLDEEYSLLTSSTPSMLTELEQALEEEDDIVVTLWKPYWANASYDVKALEDPKGAMGDPETMHVLGTAGFSEEFPDAADYIAGISLDDALYESLEDTVVNQFEDGDEPAAIDQWISENPDAFETLIAE
ncbi:glycine betaine ABC transporter substrate-binding protein [Microbacterium sp. G2-8]|uniref:glycine betaine ABC transporter substrate-binding protein n=1 Tax=Microbacterium sp. G2-8 TaxID=2842454 RepID=UPI001C897776|nr:glycine betaine ABC transporter substrate-binding protein [Microbacterium sp. G2-8]